MPASSRTCHVLFRLRRPGFRVWYSHGNASRSERDTPGHRPARLGSIPKFGNLMLLLQTRCVGAPPRVEWTWLRNRARVGTRAIVASLASEFAACAAGWELDGCFRLLAIACASRVRTATSGHCSRPSKKGACSVALQAPGNSRIPDAIRSRRAARTGSSAGCCTAGTPARTTRRSSCCSVSRKRCD